MLALHLSAQVQIWVPSGMLLPGAFLERLRKAGSHWAQGDTSKCKDLTLHWLALSWLVLSACTTCGNMLAQGTQDDERLSKPCILLRLMQGDTSRCKVKSLCFLVSPCAQWEPAITVPSSILQGCTHHHHLMMSFHQDWSNCKLPALNKIINNVLMSNKLNGR